MREVELNHGSFRPYVNMRIAYNYQKWQFTSTSFCSSGVTMNPLILVEGPKQKFLPYLFSHPLSVQS